MTSIKHSEEYTLENSLRGRKIIATIETRKGEAPKITNMKILERDTGYRFSDRDPDLEFVCNAITASAKSPKELSADVNRIAHGAANVAVSTISNWLSGKVRKPQNFTLTWVMRALGYERNWNKMS